jgi:hypothetical protein
MVENPYNSNEPRKGWEGRDGYLTGSSNPGEEKRGGQEAKSKDNVSKLNQTSSQNQSAGKRYYCHKCKGPVALNQIFCIRCGTKLKW